VRRIVGKREWQPRLAPWNGLKRISKSLTAELKQSFYGLRQSSIDENLFDVILLGFNALV